VADVTAARVAGLIGRRRGLLRYTTERQLQDALEVLFASEGLGALREQPLGPLDRPDFLIGGVAVEVKVGGTPDALERQVTRYLTHDTVTAVVVVTNRARHRGLPPEISGKPVLVVFLAGGPR
jgi:hypothetical protein